MPTSTGSNSASSNIYWVSVYFNSILTVLISPLWCDDVVKLVVYVRVLALVNFNLKAVFI